MPGTLPGTFPGSSTTAGFPYAASSAPAPNPYGGAPNPYGGAFGQGNVGAAYSLPPEFYAQSVPAVVQTPSASVHTTPAKCEETVKPAEPEDLLMFDDDEPATQVGATTDLLDFTDSYSDPSGQKTGNSPEATAAQILKLKARGNDLVRAKQHAEAVKSYECALQLMDTEPDGGDTKSLKAVLHANIAMCELQQQLYRRAVDSATRSIENDATHAKAYYRRCLAFRALKMFDEARRDLDALQFCRHQLTDAEMQKLRNSLMQSPSST